MKSTLFRCFMIVSILVFLLSALLTQGVYSTPLAGISTVKASVPAQTQDFAKLTDESSEDPTIVYIYDALGRLIYVEYSTGMTITYSYDAAGNMLTKTVLKNGDITGNGMVNIADAMLLANHVSYPYHDPPYVISSPFVADVTGNGVVNIADAMLLANNVSYPYHDPPYVLK